MNHNPVRIRDTLVYETYVTQTYTGFFHSWKHFQAKNWRKCVHFADCTSELFQEAQYIWCKRYETLEGLHPKGEYQNEIISWLFEFQLTIGHFSVDENWVRVEKFIPTIKNEQLQFGIINFFNNMEPGFTNCDIRIDNFLWNPELEVYIFWDILYR